VGWLARFAPLPTASPNPSLPRNRPRVRGSPRTLGRHRPSRRPLAALSRPTPSDGRDAEGRQPQEELLSASPRGGAGVRPGWRRWHLRGGGLRFLIRGPTLRIFLPFRPRTYATPFSVGEAKPTLFRRTGFEFKYEGLRTLNPALRPSI
jgi:hypothetical protein